MGLCIGSLGSSPHVPLGTLRLTVHACLARDGRRIPEDTSQVPEYPLHLASDERQKPQISSPLDGDFNPPLAERARARALPRIQLALRCDQLGQGSYILVVHQAPAFLHEAAIALCSHGVPASLWFRSIPHPHQNGISSSGMSRSWFTSSALGPVGAPCGGRC